jgi:hypothetical protein
MEKQTKNEYRGLTGANQHATQARIENRDDWTKNTNRRGPRVET